MALMALKHDLLEKGYLPENLPPTFVTTAIGANLAARNGWLTNGKHPVRSSPFNASKRGMTRREFSFVHPSTAHDLARFVADREAELMQHFALSDFSLSKPVHNTDMDRAVTIASHSEVESARLARLARYRFVARTDISRFYHTIYTHSIPWALHGRAAAKADRSPASANCYANRLDLIVRAGQDGQTVGVPVGPDASRYVAEVIGTAIDQEFVRRGGDQNCDLIRHVDDVWIGADTHAAAEEALWRYREAIRFFELDINESKTAIYSDNFSFSDTWPTDIAAKFEFASNSLDRRIPERLRAALEYSFSLTLRNNDDGVLKYTLRYLDRSNLAATQWPVVEPFLKRAAVHFGHSIDYVARIIVWRHLAFRDLVIADWSPILTAILDRHGRLGNDGEVSWALYAAIRLGIEIPISTANLIVQNCGPLTVMALLSCVEQTLVAPAVFDAAAEIVANETGSGPYWPLLLEWRSRQWAGSANLTFGNDLIEDLAQQGITLFAPNKLPSVFQGLNENDFGSVAFAIEERSSQYDDNNDEEGQSSLEESADHPFPIDELF
jgi:hypothetical protein